MNIQHKALFINLIISFFLFACDSQIEPTNDRREALKNASIAGADEALFAGDSEEKVLTVLKRSLTEDKNVSVKDTSYYSNELGKNVVIYDLLLNNNMIQSFYICDNKLRNMFGFLNKIPNSRTKEFIEKVNKEPNLNQVKQGVYKSLSSPNEEYIMFVMINNLKTDSTAIMMLSGPNSNKSDEIITAFVESTKKKAKSVGLEVEINFVE